MCRANRPTGTEPKPSMSPAHGSKGSQLLRRKSRRELRGHFRARYSLRCEKLLRVPTLTPRPAAKGRTRPGQARVRVGRKVRQQGARWRGRSFLRFRERQPRQYRQLPRQRRRYRRRRYRLRQLPPALPKHRRGRVPVQSRSARRPVSSR